MFTSNPFAELSAFVPPTVMQTYIVVMVVLVAVGTLFDIIHKRSARYFFDNWRASKNSAMKQVAGGDMISIAVQTALHDVLASGEFCNARRRVAHLLGMYGFVIYVVTTAIMVFAYPTPATPTPDVLAMLWYIGALMVCLGGYWFWFFIRVDVVAEGNSPFRFVRADLFIVSLVLSTTFGLIWAWLQTAGNTTWATVFLGFISSPPQHYLERFLGPSSRTCSSSPPRPSRNDCPRLMAPAATCRLPPTRRKNSAASSSIPIIIDRPRTGLRQRG